MKKSIATVALAATAFSGAVAGAAVVPTLVGAQEEDAPAEIPDAPAQPDQGERGSWVADTLQELVDEGVIDQSQADAVAERLAEAKPERGGRGGRLGGRLGETLTGVLGVEADELREAFANGDSLADVAEANGVEPQAVIDAIVEQADERLDVAVENGRITEDEADEIRAEQVERITDMVNGEVPEDGFRRGGGRRGFGPGRFGGGGAAVEDTADA